MIDQRLVTNHIDPRIGVLMREGAPVYYAAIDGEFPERSTPEAVLALLNGEKEAIAPPARRSQVPTARARSRFRTYIVRVEAKFPGAFDRPDEIEIEARNKREAERRVREQVIRDTGHSSRIEGALFVTARRRDD